MMPAHRLPRRLWPLALAAALANLLPLSASAAVEGGERHSGHPEWMVPGLIDLESDLETVRDEGMTGVMVLYTTAGCSYCARFEKLSLKDPTLQAKLRQHFVPIGLEIFDDVIMTGPDGEDRSIKEFAEEHGAGMAPTLLFFDANGERVLRAVGYQTPERFDMIMDYLIEGANQTLTFRDYALQRLQRDQQSYPELRADPAFMTPPFALARQPIAAERPLLVLFERTGCSACARFHDQVLADEDVRAVLEQFDVVRLDADDDKTPVLAPDGRKTTPAAWFADAGFSRLPAILYVDEQGQPVFQNDAVTERNRFLNMSNLVLEKKYLEGWSYQRYARSKAIARNRAAAAAASADNAPAQ
jgi:thioredoxin-related protein